jgi:hypothetical protein
MKLENTQLFKGSQTQKYKGCQTVVKGSKLLPKTYSKEAAGSSPLAQIVSWSSYAILKHRSGGVAGSSQKQLEAAL